MKFHFCAINSQFIHTCLAAHILCAEAAAKGFDCTLSEYSINDQMNAVIGELFGMRADVYLFPVYIFNVEYVKELIDTLKKVLPQCRIVLGGPEVTYGATFFLAQNTSADIIVLGEGEKPVAALLQALTAGDALSNVSNIAYRQDKNVMLSPQIEELIPMDSIAFPYHDGNITDYAHKILYYESMRGCPFSCAYCLSANEHTLRMKSLEKVYEELSFFIRHRIPIIKFTDRTFNVDARRALRIWQFIKEHNIATTFHFEIAADLLTEEHLALLENMPPDFVQLEIGIQSANEKTLQAVSRTTNLTNIATAVKRLVKTDNIHLHTDLIAGLPYETYESFRTSFNFVYALGAQMLQLGFLKILRGSPMEHIAHKQQYVYETRAPYEVLSTPWLSFEEILRLKALEQLVEKYANSQSFSYILAYIIPHLYAEDAFAFFEDLTSFFIQKDLFRRKVSKPTLYTILLEFLTNQSVDRDICLTLLQFDYLLSMRVPLPKTLALPQLIKTDLFDAIERNRALFPEKYSVLPYKQLIKYLRVYVFNRNPLTLHPSPATIAFWNLPDKKAASLAPVFLR